MLPRKARLKDLGARTYVQTEIDLGAKFGVHRSRADSDCIVAAPVACDLYRNFIGRATRDCSSVFLVGILPQSISDTTGLLTKLALVKRKKTGTG
jgi:hypothetical protein